MSFFKKIKELFVSPEKPKTHGDWFYHTKLISKKLVLFYKQIQKANTNQQIFKTGNEILPAELSFNITADEVLKIWGKPRCSFNNNKSDANILVFFYRRNFIYENTLLQLQFFNRKLFFVCLEVGKGMMNENTKVKMLNNFLPGFISDNFKQSKEIPIFTDTNNNYVLVEDDINLNICFFSGIFANQEITTLEQALINPINQLESDV